VKDGERGWKWTAFYLGLAWGGRPHRTRGRRLLGCLFVLQTRGACRECGFRRGHSGDCNRHYRPLFVRTPANPSAKLVTKYEEAGVWAKDANFNPTTPALLLIPYLAALNGDASGR
jgi:hypothetical protein